MADGISFMLNLDAKYDQMLGAGKAVDKLNAAIERTAAGITKMEQRVGGAARKMGHWFHEVGESAKKDFLGFFAAEAAWDGLKEGVHLIAELVTEMFTAGGAAQRTRLSFENMLGVTEGGELLEYLDKVSKHTEFTGATLKGFGQQLLDAGFEGDKLSSALAAISDVAARSPDKMAGAEKAIMALSQLNLKGSIDARQLTRSLHLSPKALFDQMAHDLGMGPKSVEKALEAGKLKTEDVINSVHKALAIKSGKPLGAVGVAMGDTFAARLEKVKTIPERLFEGLSTTKGFGQVTVFMGKLADAFDPASPTGKKIIGGLNDLADRVGGAFGSIKMDEIADDIVKGMEILEGAVTVAKVALVDPLVAIGKGFVFVGETIGESVAQIYLLGEKVYTAANYVGSAIWRGIKDGAIGGLGKIGEAAGDLAYSAVQSVKGALGIHSPSKVFEGLGKYSAMGYERGLLLEAPSVRGATEAMVTPSSAPARPMLMGGGATVTIGDVIVNVAQPGASAEEIGDVVQQRLSSELLYAFERLGLESGAG